MPTVHALSAIALDCAWVSTVPTLSWYAMAEPLLGSVLPYGQCGEVPIFADFLLAGSGFTYSPLPECTSSRLLHAVSGHVKRGTSHRATSRPPRKGRAASFRLTCSSSNARSLLEQGKLLFVTRQLEALDVDVLCVQETRLRDVLQLDTVNGYKLCLLPAEPARGGLAVMVRVRAGIEVLEQKCHGPRVLRVSLRVNGALVHIVSARAPIEEDSELAHSTFEEHVVAALTLLGVGKVILGCDLNAKLKELELSLVGSCALSKCRWGASHRIHLLRELDRRGMKALNTLHAEATDFTWKHANGTLSQIDFIVADDALAMRLERVYVEQWGVMDLSTSSDHRMVSARFELGLVLKPPKREGALCRFKDEAHFAQFAARVRQGGLPTWSPQTPPGEYLTALMGEVRNIMLATTPIASPRQPWVAQRTWEFLCLLNKYRRLLGALVRDEPDGARRIASEVLHHTGESFYPVEETDAVSGCHAAIAALGRVTKRLLREDRRTWIDTMCQRLRSYGDSHDMRALHRTVRQLCRSGCQSSWTAHACAGRHYCN
eukprot:2706491-Amphidinium_carterae.2